MKWAGAWLCLSLAKGNQKEQSHSSFVAAASRTISPTKRHFVMTSRYTVLQETDKTLSILSSPALKHVTFFMKISRQAIFLWTTF